MKLPNSCPTKQETTSLLLIEDDSDIAHDIRGYFTGLGYDVECATTGPLGMAQARVSKAHVFIIDRMLPGVDGLSIIRSLRDSGIRTPAIVLSALDGVDERIMGLRAGGDDYLGKPFALTELAARVEALLRRPSQAAETTLRVGALHLDLVTRRVSYRGRKLDLLPREFRLLEYMARRPGQTITRAMLFEAVWAYNFTPNSNLVDVHIGRLRRKLAQANEPDAITNVWGVGFILNAAS